MKVKSIKIHNIRSIKDAHMDLHDYSVLTGENNAGKTNVVTALRLFYEEDGLKFNEKRDFPKFQTDDNDSWVEIDFETTDEEQNLLRDDYKSSNNVLTVRRYFKSENGYVKSSQSNIYGYKNGTLSEELFYGAKNISQARLGNIIYIPEISKTDDTFKLSGPSPFRNVVNYVMNNVVKKSAAYQALESAFIKFNSDFKEEKPRDGESFSDLIEEINSEVSNWNINFGIDFNPIKPQEIVKNLVSHYIEDKNLNNQRVDVTSYGQGLQRHLIYTLLRISAKYQETQSNTKRDFYPDFTLLLFEEPEAFLHPSQQDNLNHSLRAIGKNSEQQVLITTHSPVFVTKNIGQINSLIRIAKQDCISNAFQLKETDVGSLFNQNLSMFKYFTQLLNDPNCDESLKSKIKSYGLGEENPDEELKLEEESIKYFLWLDNERASSFFAKHIIICEGASEKVLFDYLCNYHWDDLKNKHIYFLDSVSKFNIHRYMNLFSKLGINHSVLMDGDNDVHVQGMINEFIVENSNSYTKEIYKFEKDVEEFLGLEAPRRRDLKPLKILYSLQNGLIHPDDIKRLRDVICHLIGHVEHHLTEA